MKDSPWVWTGFYHWIQIIFGNEKNISKGSNSSFNDCKYMYVFVTEWFIYLSLDMIAVDLWFIIPCSQHFVKVNEFTLFCRLFLVWISCVRLSLEWVKLLSLSWQLCSRLSLLMDKFLSLSCVTQESLHSRSARSTRGSASSFPQSR